MNNSEWEKCYESLLSCVIGLISTLDLHHIKETIDSMPNNDLKVYYEKSLDDHAKMSIYNNSFIQ